MSKRSASLAKLAKHKTFNAVRVHHGSDKSSNHGRSKSTMNVLKMYRDKGKLSNKLATDADASVRIEPSRKWFGNTRVVDQKQLERYREALKNKIDDPMSLLVKRTKLPMSLLTTLTLSNKKNKLLTCRFDVNKKYEIDKCKNPNLEYGDLADLAKRSNELTEKFTTELQEKQRVVTEKQDDEILQESIMAKGTSKRIWGELYKVVDSSDILLEILDARDPMGTRCMKLEKHIKEDKPFKHIVLVLNKCDLVPESVTRNWVKYLSQYYPTVAFKASIKHCFGKRSLIALIRQLADMFKNRKHVSVGVIGYPNVGKSSLINTLRGKKVCNTAPIPGETKVWQYVELTKKVYLIDCPGITVDADKSYQASCSKVIKGTVRAEKLDNPEIFIDSIIEAVGRKKFMKFYGLDDSFIEETNSENILVALAHKWGKLMKGGEPHIGPVAVKIINDIQRGVIPYFRPPPKLNAKINNSEDENECGKMSDYEHDASQQSCSDTEANEQNGFISSEPVNNQ